MGRTAGMSRPPPAVRAMGADQWSVLTCSSFVPASVAPAGTEWTKGRRATAAPLLVWEKAELSRCVV
jgi:hypothetical protein